MVGGQRSVGSRCDDGVDFVLETGEDTEMMWASVANARSESFSILIFAFSRSCST